MVTILLGNVVTHMYLGLNSVLYNPQIEMFARFKNEKFISQNEAYNLKHSLFHLNWSILS